MAFTATKRELGELYTFFRLLADGQVNMGTASSQIKENDLRPIAMIQRVEHDGARRYYIEQNDVRIVAGEIEKKTNLFVAKTDVEEIFFSREDFDAAASMILSSLKSQSGEDIEVCDELEGFLDTVRIFDLEAKTEDRTDISIAFWHPEAPLTGFCIRCRLSPMNPLLDGGRTANLKLEQSGVKFAVPTVNKVNALPESPNEVMERMLMIERLGGVLKYNDVADKVYTRDLFSRD